jgi:pantoate--beta-alanine ligase
MRVIKNAASMRRLAGRWIRQGVRIGFVPTMGYLHEGHISLVRRARKEAGKTGKVIVSIYVNPTQFGPAEDLSRYPRDFARDKRLCGSAGVDVVFAPTDGEMYLKDSDQQHSTYVVEERLSLSMEGQSRPTHFRGVTTIVAKLFNIVRPEVAVFGAKDWQQAAVIQRMVRDLNFAVRVIVAPTAREADGLAMSSRNKYLEGELRQEALVLSRVIKFAREAVRARSVVSAASLRRECGRLMKRAPHGRMDYIEFFDPHTLRPVRQVRKGAHVALAVFIGKTRLIDNASI